jgi:hypothetical protein
MSIRVMSEIWDRAPVDKQKLLVLLSLGDNANDQGYCWPSVSYIGKKCRITPRQARRIISELVVLGEIERHDRPGMTNGFMLSKYAENVLPRTKSDLPRTKSDPPRTQLCPTTPDIAMSSEPSLNHQSESSEQRDVQDRPGSAIEERPLSCRHQKPVPTTGRGCSGAISAISEDQAESLYSIFPRKQAKGACISAIKKALRNEKYEILLSAVKEYADAVGRWPESAKRKQDGTILIPMASTWFNQERWKDERSEWDRGRPAPKAREDGLGTVYRPKEF